MKLSPVQLAQFDRDGYLAFPDAGVNFMYPCEPATVWEILLGLLVCGADPSQVQHMVIFQY